MKRCAFFAVGGILLLAFVACGKTAKTEVTGEPSMAVEEQEAVAAPETEPVKDEWEYDYYNISDTEAGIYGLNVPAGVKEIEIPQSIVTETGEEKTVVEVSQLILKDTDVEKVVLPETVTSIGKETFYNASSLREVDIQGTILTIGEAAFFGCDQLEYLSFPEGLTMVQHNGLMCCDNLRELHLPSSLSEESTYFSSAFGAMDAFADDFRLYAPEGSDIWNYAQELGVTLIAE